VHLSSEQVVQLRALVTNRHVTPDVALRARIVLWVGEGRRRKDVADLAGVSARTVDRTKTRYAEGELARCLASAGRTGTARPSWPS
jgi:transposase